MKNIIHRIAVLSVVLFSFTSCEVVGGIFKAGMGFGIFMVVTVVAVVIFGITKIFGGKK
jgi:hypothetical protein